MTEEIGGGIRRGTVQGWKPRVGVHVVCLCVCVCAFFVCMCVCVCAYVCVIFFTKY